MRRKDLVRAALVASTAIAVVVGPSAVPSGAAPYEKGHFHDVGSEPLEDFCELDVRYDYDLRGSYRAMPRGRDGYAFFAENVQGTESWTNLATGKSYTHTFAATIRDQKVTDNGDGTLTIDVGAAGGDRWYDADGNLYLRDPGQVRFRIVVDHNDTPTDPFDDTEVSFSILRESTGLNEGHDRDFCEDLRTVTA